MILTEKDQARFWSKVALPDANGCMLWTDGTDRKGYGRMRVAGKTPGAHRISYELAYGPIPDGLQVDHVKARGCTNRHCVAPAHLEAVTLQENVRRGEAGKYKTLRTHCPKGHEYTEANTYRRFPSGRRNCRTCGNDATKARRAR